MRKQEKGLACHCSLLYLGLATQQRTVRVYASKGPLLGLDQRGIYSETLNAVQLDQWGSCTRHITGQPV